MNWIDKLQQRWKLKSTMQVVVVLIVFACTGFTIYFIKRPLFAYLFDGQSMPLWATVIYYILILPIYNIFLLLYGLIFGQFQFFWDFEKRFFNRIFKSSKTTNTNNHEK